MTPAVRPLGPLMAALKIDTPTKLARLIGQEVSSVSAAFDAGEVEEPRASIWAKRAGVDPEAVWPTPRMPVLPPGMEWIESLPPARTSGGGGLPWPRRLAALRQAPGRWAQVAERPSGAVAREVARRISKAMGDTVQVEYRAVDPDGPYASPHRVYVRWVG